MNNLNSILIEGNLVRDPMIRTTPKGISVCTLTLASNRFYKDEGGLEKEVGFFDVESWGKLAEAIYAKGKIGRGVRVVGRLKQDRWTGTDGKTHARISIVAEHLEFRPEFKKGSNASEEEIVYEDEEVREYAEAAGVPQGEPVEEFALAG